MEIRTGPYRLYLHGSTLGIFHCGIPTSRKQYRSTGTQPHRLRGTQGTRLPVQQHTQGELCIPVQFPDMQLHNKGHGLHRVLHRGRIGIFVEQRTPDLPRHSAPIHKILSLDPGRQRHAFGCRCRHAAITPCHLLHTRILSECAFRGSGA